MMMMTFEYKKHINIQNLQNFRFKLGFIKPENEMVPLGFSPLTWEIRLLHIIRNKNYKLYMTHIINLHLQEEKNWVTYTKNMVLNFNFNFIICMKHAISMCHM